MKAEMEIGFLHETFEGETPEKLFEAMERVQDFECLLEAGRNFEENKKELDKIEYLLDRFYCDELSFDDIKNLDINLSIGNIKCLSMTGEPAVEG